MTVEVMGRVLRADSNCVDAGAAMGELLQEMVRLAPEGNHFAFEPLPRQARALKRKFPSVHVEQVALADTKGTATFRHVMNAPRYSGFDRFDRPDWDTYNERVKLIEVRVERLDDCLPPELPLHFMKVDVEGAEWRLFQGAVRTVRKYRPHVVFEIGADQDDVYDFFIDAGMGVSVIDVWLEGRPPLDKEEFQREYKRLRNWMFLAHPV